MVTRLTIGYGSRSTTVGRILNRMAQKTKLARKKKRDQRLRRGATLPRDRWMVGVGFDSR